MNRQYYSMVQTGKTATVNIYGDIVGYSWIDGDVSANDFVSDLEKLKDVSQIDVYISSYGGEVQAGLAIYNALKRHSAKIRTIVDGFACSIASVVFMAGDERIMNDASLLMVHNAWTFAEGNAADLRKQADDLEKITQASIIAYKAHSNLSEEEIKALMDAESWLLPEEALEYGFATGIEKTEQKKASQSARRMLIDIVKQHRQAEEEPKDDPEEPETEEDSEDETEETPENDAETPPEDEEDEQEGEDTGEEDPAVDEQEKAAQMWSGFFNALSKI